MHVTNDNDISKDAHIRRLGNHNETAVVQHFERMDPHARRMRFGAGTSPEFVRRYAKRSEFPYIRRGRRSFG